MYRIVGKENLFAVNEVADRCLRVLHNAEEIEDQEVKLDKDILLSIASGYLYLYNIVLEEALIPNTTSTKHNIFNLH